MPTHMISESEWLELEEDKELIRMEKQIEALRPKINSECYECKHLRKGGGCSVYLTCESFRTWFGQEWANIREAAARLQKRK